MYINEALKLGKSRYKYHPKTKEELQKIINKRIKEEGKECNLNDNLSHLKTFSLDFTDSSQKKLITCSLTDLVNTDFI